MTRALRLTFMFLDKISSLTRTMHIATTYKNTLQKFINTFQHCTILTLTTSCPKTEMLTDEGIGPKHVRFVWAN